MTKKDPGWILLALRDNQLDLRQCLAGARSPVLGLTACVGTPVLPLMGIELGTLQLSGDNWVPMPQVL